MNDPHRDGEASVQVRDESPYDVSSTPTIQISHHDVRSRLSDYLDGSLPEAEKRVVEDHLAGCRDCRAFRATLRNTVYALDSLPVHHATEAAKERVLSRLRERAAQDEEADPGR